MNMFEKWATKIVQKAIGEQGNQLFQQMFSWINTDNPIWIGERQRDYIDKGYLYNDLVYSIIKTKADAAKSVDWVLYKIKDPQKLRQYQAMVEKGDTINKTMKLKKQALEEVDNNISDKIINAPNHYQSLGEIIEEYFSWMDLMGNFYLYGSPDAAGGKFQSVHVAPAHKVEIIAGTMFDPIKGYRLQNWFAGDNIDPKNVLHLKNWNPDFDESGRHLYGVSPLRAGGRILTLDNEGIDTSASTFKNQGVRGILHRAGSADLPDMSPEQVDDLKNKVTAMQGKGRAGGIAATDSAVGFTKIGDSPVDMGVLTAMDKNLQRMCNLLQVPVELFAPGSTFNNKAEARKHMITTAIIPRLNIIRNRLNRWWVKPYGNYFLDYDVMSITELQDDLESKVKMLNQMDWITDNEKRTATDYEAYDHGLADTLWVDPMKVPIEQADYDTDIEQARREEERARQ